MNMHAEDMALITTDLQARLIVSIQDCDHDEFFSILEQWAMHECNELMDDPFGSFAFLQAALYGDKMILDAFKEHGWDARIRLSFGEGTPYEQYNGLTLAAACLFEAPVERIEDLIERDWMNLWIDKSASHGSFSIGVFGALQASDKIFDVIMNSFLTLIHQSDGKTLYPMNPERIFVDFINCANVSIHKDDDPFYVNRLHTIIQVWCLENFNKSIPKQTMDLWKELTQQPEIFHSHTSAATTFYRYVWDNLNGTQKKRASQFIRCNMDHPLMWQTAMTQMNLNDVLHGMDMIMTKMAERHANIEALSTTWEMAVQHLRDHHPDIHQQFPEFGKSSFEFRELYNKKMTTQKDQLQLFLNVGVDLQSKKSTSKRKM